MIRSLIAVLLLCSAAPALSQQTQPASELRVYLLTVGPGDHVWEKFGHNALWLEDLSTGTSIAYNWGMFDFNQPGFVPRLMQGRMLYWMEGIDAPLLLGHYASANRTMWAQELNLTPAERVALREFLFWHAREENKYYLYDYYRDNCSTRVRDAIDRASNGQLQRALRARPTNQTYRSHTQRLTYDAVPVYAGIMLALGPRTDRALTEWEAAFIPMELMEAVRQVRVRGSDGTEQPLVLSERTLFEARERTPPPETAPNVVLPYTIAGVVVALVLVLLARAAANRRAVNIVLAVLLAIWSLKIGVFGTLITLLWAFTDHVVTYANENLLQANPLSLLLLVFAPALLLGKAWAQRWGVWLALTIAGLSVMGLVLQVFPFVDQVNGEIIGVLMPIHIAVAYILFSRSRSTRLAER